MHNLAGILLVDDDSTSIFLTQLLLDRLALAPRVLVAENGAHGLQLLHEVLAEPLVGEPSSWLVLLDVNMPVLNGFEFLQAFQQLPEAQQQRVTVVVLTTSLHVPDLAQLQQLPMAGLASKPLTEAKLVSFLRQSVLPSRSSVQDSAERVFQLLYCSRATRPLPEAELYALLTQARQANAARQITGVLVYQHGHYVQVLEGPEEEVRALYTLIQQDPRHARITTLSERTDCPRAFAPWRMALGSAALPAIARLYEAVLAPTFSGEAPLDDLIKDAARAVLTQEK